MGYKATVDLLILKDLKRRAEEFAATYDPSLQTVLLVPGGMGSRLLKTTEEVVPGIPFPDQPTFQKIWLSFAAILFGDILGLRMTRAEHDRGNRPVIASGEVSSSLAKKYDNTRDYFAGSSPVHPANYVVFGYDWRKLNRVSASYLRQFLLLLRKEVEKLGHADPRPQITLLAHSQGGLVTKLLLNDLVDSDEDPHDWLARFVSVGTPFYGTQNHLSRYYVGAGLVNITPGGRSAVADLIWSLPGPYVLLPAPRTVLEPRFDALGLNRYPVVDRDHLTVEVDPFLAAQRTRLPGFMTSPADNLTFTVSRLASAAQELAEVDRDLPTLGDRVFHIRSTLRHSDTPRSFRIHWENVNGSNYDIEQGPDPVSDNGGDSDGTVPLWSARLAWIADQQVFTAKGLKHGGLAEQPDVLDAVAAIIKGDPVDLPALSQELDIAPEADAFRLLEEVRQGHREMADLAIQPPEMQRRFAAMLELP